MRLATSIHTARNTATTIASRRQDNLSARVNSKAVDVTSAVKMAGTMPHVTYSVAQPVETTSATVMDNALIVWPGFMGLTVATAVIRRVMMERVIEHRETARNVTSPERFSHRDAELQVDTGHRYCI